FQFPNLASAQVGTCEPALGQAILDAGNVRAKIQNNGGLFWRGEAPVYEVPKDDGVSAIFAAGIWIAGLIDGELRGAATRYGSWEFWAGPLDDAGNPPDDCLPFDKIWEINRDDIQTLIDSDSISSNLRNWPWQLGAPVVDGDGDPHNYNLQQGDLPELFGDQRLWWIMNDRGNVHESTDGEPIGLEIQASAHAINFGFISNVTFYDYHIINKNKQDFTNVYLTYFNDVDLGNFDDDYVGSDSTLHLGYTYNADNNDEGGYGLAPPAIGTTFLKTALAPEDGLDNDRDGVIDEPDEMIGATSVVFYNGGGAITGDPVALQDYYFYMQSKWKDGKPVTFGGSGRDFTNQPVKFVYPGNPATLDGWSERNPDPTNGTLPPIDPADRRVITTTGPFTIISRDTLNIRFAIVWSRGKNHLDSVTELKKDVATIHQAAEAYFAPTRVIESPTEMLPRFILGFDANFPNPFAQSTNFRYSLPQPMQVRLAVFDMLGREVAMLVDQQQEAGIYTVNFEAGTLPSGIYLARIELDHLRFTKRMVLAR
ncbi:unnamed protein product, partial [Laminaria digitata]